MKKTFCILFLLIAILASPVYANTADSVRKSAGAVFTKDDGIYLYSEGDGSIKSIGSSLIGF